jgi:hypothetical protein
VRALQNERKTVLSRRDLYELVWSTPVTKLAEQFGISDRGLAKICERHRVPTPPRGYWAKLEAGAKPKKAVFAEASDDALNVIEINPTLSNMPPEARRIVERARAERKAHKAPRAAKGSERPKIELVEQAHSLIATTAKVLRKHSGVGMAHVSGAGLMPLRLGKDNIERALAFLDMLIRRLEAKEITLTLTDQGMKAAIGPDSLTFTLSERTKWEVHEPTEEELAAEKRRQAKIHRIQVSGSWSSDWPARAYPERDEIPQGELVLQVDGWWRDNVRRRWADGKIQRMENLLDSIVTGFEVLLAARKANRLEDERREREQAELARRQRLAEERRNREKKRRDLLKDVMHKSVEAATIRQWLSSLDLTNAEEDEEFARFVTWAQGKLATLEIAVSRRNITAIVESQALFPTVDTLRDPLGEPPRRYYYGMPPDDD